MLGEMMTASPIATSSLTSTANGKAAANPTPLTARTARGVVEYVATGQGPTLLALHGIVGGWDQALLLARSVGPARFRTLALSRPGYLGTTLAAGRSPEEQADLYAATLDTLGVERATVLAISGGSRSAIWFALRHRDRCSALVLVSSIGEAMGAVPLRHRLMMWLGHHPWFVGRIQRRMERDPGARARRTIAQIRDPDIRARMLADPEASPLFHAFSASTGDRFALRLPGTRQDMLVGRTPSPPLEEVRVPTLVVHGTDDRTVPFARHGALLARRIPGAELLAIEGGDHFAVFTHRPQIRARVDAFLRAHVPA
jgi:pimeloyl-ACP methyl ester carboxylesterase